MNRVKKTITCIGLFALFSQSACDTGSLESGKAARTRPQAESVVGSNVDPTAKRKHAVIMCSFSNRDMPLSKMFDEGTRNAFLITIADIFHSLRRMGYQASDIQVLYNDGTIDTSETRNADRIAQLAREKYGTDSIQPATKANFDTVMTRLEGSVKAGDQFILVLMNHGNLDGETTYVKYFTKKKTKERLYPTDLLSKLNNIRADQQLIVIDACHSGNFGRVIGTGNRVVLTSSDKGPSIYSRIDQFSRSVFNATVDSTSDENGDGKVTVAEAFSSGEEQRKPILAQHKKAGHLAFRSVEIFYGRIFNEQKSFPLYDLRGHVP